jgi:hypothetical protein
MSAPPKSFLSRSSHFEHKYFVHLLLVFSPGFRYGFIHVYQRNPADVLPSNFSAPAPAIQPREFGQTIADTD